MTSVREISAQGHEHVFAFRDDATGLAGYLAIHNTLRGPAFGGFRIAPYRSDLAALSDAMRLSRSMAYKTALAGLPCGAGQAVLVQHFGLKWQEAFTEFGRIVELCGGRFFCTPDPDITPQDLAFVHKMTRYCIDPSSRGLGDLSEHTAIGVWEAMRACLEFLSIRRLRVAIQGMGRAGMHLARILHKHGAELIVTDIDRERSRAAQKEFGAKLVAPDDIFSIDCDVLAPCAVGATINSYTIPRLGARIVCGSSQNPLASRKDAELLRDRDILYAPDCLVNAGGVIRTVEFHLRNKPDSRAALRQIGYRMNQVLTLAEERNVSTAQIADELAEAQLNGSESGRPVAQTAGAPA